MAKHKNQHFVPRCYLRSFSRDCEGHAINLYQIPRRRFVQDAPVKGQCAKPYFYGRDLQLERALQGMEGEYARVFASISAGSYSSIDSDLRTLREFMLLQVSRTSAAIQRTQQLWVDSQDLLQREFSDGLPRYRINTHEMMIMTMGLYADMSPGLTDLKLSIIRNRTSRDFVTSDDPVVFASMFHAKHVKTDRFGFGSAGVLFFFPLSPRLLLLAYDGDVYTLSNKRRGVVSLSREKDVYACNELQYLNASQAIYFSDWDSRNRVQQEITALGSSRPFQQPKFSRFVQDESTPSWERYRELQSDESSDAEKMIISMSLSRIMPKSWVSLLRLRRKMRYFHDGSAAGYLRFHTLNNDFGC